MTSRRLPGRTLAELFAIGAVTTLLVLPGGAMPVSDTQARLGVAHWLWSGTPPLEGVPAPVPFVLRDREGRLTPWFGIGHSLVLLPADMIASAAGASTHRQRFLIAEYLTFPVVNGLLVAAAGAFLAAAGFTAFAAGAGAIALALCSTVLWHFQNNQENGLQFLLVLTALIGALRWTEDRRARWLAVSGACLGFNLLIRLPNIVDVLVVAALPLLLVKERASYVRDWMRFALPGVAAGIAIDRIYHFARFGEWTTNYMSMKGALAQQLGLRVPPGFPFSNDFWAGMIGPFVSLHVSIFLFDPLLIVTAIVLAARWGRVRLPLKALAAGSVVGILLVAAGYARYYNWSGFAGWGNRFLTTWVWMACLLAVPMLIELDVRRRVIGAVVAIALSLQLCSVVFPAWLEEVQLGMQTTIDGLVMMPDGRLDHFVIGQRVRNILDTVSGTSTFHPPILPVAMPLQTLPPWAALLTRVGWCALAVGLAWYARRFLRRLSRES